MENETQKKEKAGTLQQGAVSGSVLPAEEIWNWKDVIKDVIINKDKDKPNTIGTALNYLAENYEVPNKIKAGKTDR